MASGLGDEPRALPLLAAMFLTLVQACASHAQTERAQPPAGPQSAQVIPLDGDDGNAQGSLSYSTGQRVAWKRFELPEDFEGTLELHLVFAPIRAGLELAFEVYDQQFQQVAVGHSSPASGQQIKTASVDHALGGTYYVQVYAPGRDDAGEYVLAVQVRRADEDAPGVPRAKDVDGLDVSLPSDADDNREPEVEQPEPPRPADPPHDVAQPAPVTARVSDFRVISGGTVRVTVNRGADDGIERGWTGQLMLGDSERPVQGGDFFVTTVTRSEARGEARFSVDQLRVNRVVVLRATDDSRSPPDLVPSRAHTDSQGGPADESRKAGDSARVGEEGDGGAPERIVARVSGYQLSERGTIVLTVNRGTGDGVERGWTAQVLRGSTEEPLLGGTFAITRVTRTEATGEAALSVDQIRANRKVSLQPGK